MFRGEGLVPWFIYRRFLKCTDYKPPSMGVEEFGRDLFQDIVTAFEENS